MTDAVPAGAQDRDEARQALRRLGALVDDLVARTGLDEDELAREMTGQRQPR